MRMAERKAGRTIARSRLCIVRHLRQGEIILRSRMRRLVAIARLAGSVILAPVPVRAAAASGEASWTG